MNKSILYCEIYPPVKNDLAQEYKNKKYFEIGPEFLNRL